MKKDEAANRVDIWSDQFDLFRGKVFCPLINGNCVEGCQCEGKPMVVYFGARDRDGTPSESERWDAENWYCENAMFYEPV